MPYAKPLAKTLHQLNGTSPKFYTNFTNLQSHIYLVLLLIVEDYFEHYTLYAIGVNIVVV